MMPVGLSGHVELSIDDLIALAVVWQYLKIGRCPTWCGTHTAFLLRKSCFAAPHLGKVAYAATVCKTPCAIRSRKPPQEAAIIASSSRTHLFALSFKDF